jgi:hypothetical protein
MSECSWKRNLLCALYFNEMTIYSRSTFPPSPWRSPRRCRHRPFRRWLSQPGSARLSWEWEAAAATGTDHDKSEHIYIYKRIESVCLFVWPAHSAAEFDILPDRWQHLWLVAIVPPEWWGEMDRNDCHTALGYFKTLISSLHYEKNNACFFSFFVFFHNL